MHVNCWIFTKSFVTDVFCCDEGLIIESLVFKSVVVTNLQILILLINHILFTIPCQPNSTVSLEKLPFLLLNLLYSRSGNEEKLMSLLTPLNVNCHASDGRKVRTAICCIY